MLFLAYLVARRAHHSGDQVSVVLAVAVGGLRASPVSWSHHWVWCVPLVMELFARRHYVAAAVGATIYTASPLTLSPLGALADSPRPVRVITTALMPAFGLWWLVSRVLRR